MGGGEKGGDSKPDGGTKSSDYDPSLPDNAAESQAAKDAADEGNPEGNPNK